MNDNVVVPLRMYVSVKGLFFAEGKLLLLHRSIEKFWDLPGGRLNTGENLESALDRELKEELPGFTSSYHSKLIAIRKKKEKLHDGSEMLLHYFVISQYALPAPLKLSAEHDEAQWFSQKELHALDHDFYGVYLTLYEQRLKENVLLL